MSAEAFLEPANSPRSGSGVPQQHARIYGLDILRALAILFVICVHVSSGLLNDSVKKWVVMILPDGVHMFFVLSGFLIGGILLRVIERDGSSPRVLLDFWIRRWMRTLPAYLFMLLLLLGLYHFTFPGFKVLDKTPYFFFLQNFNHPHPDFFGEAWSLSVEEWFYLLIPSALFLVISVFGTRPRLVMPMIALAVMLFCCAIRYHRYASLHIQTEAELGTMIWTQVITRMDSLMFGLLAAYALHYFPSFWKSGARAAFWAGLLLILLNKVIGLLVFGRSAFFHSNLSLPISSLSYMLLLPYLNQVRSGSGWLYRGLTRISIISYSLYLVHSTLIIGIILNQYCFRGNDQLWVRGLRFGLFWVLAFPAASLMYRYVEKPFMDLREKWTGNRKDRLPLAAFDRGNNS